MEEPVIGGGRRVGRITSVIFMKKFQVQKREKMSKRRSRVRHLNDGKSVQKFSPWMSYHAVFAFLVPSLIDILEVNAQGSTKSLFETHPINIWIFLVSTFIYSLAFAADRKSYVHGTTYSQLLSVIAFVSGSLSVASLVSMIVPPEFGHLVYIIWALVVLSVIAYQYDTLIKHASHWLHGKIKKIIFKFLEFWIKLKGSNRFREQQQQLPV